MSPFNNNDFLQESMPLHANGMPIKQRPDKMALILKEYFSLFIKNPL